MNFNNQNLNYFTYLFYLIFIFFFYVTVRAISGFELISDEIYFLKTDVFYDNRRWIFLAYAQMFDSINFNILNVLFLNFICLIISYHFISKINSNNYFLTFFQMFYVTAISSYVLRDVLILALFSISVYYSFYLFNEKVVNFAKKLKVFLLILASLLILSQLRFQYLIMFFTSFLGAFFLSKYPKKTFVIFLPLIYYVISNFDSSYFYDYRLLDLNNIFVYDFSIYDFLLNRADRWGVDLSVQSLFTSSIRHIFAPLPHSLILRIISPETWHIYGVLDDIYRLIFRISFLIVIYILSMNISKIPKIFYKNKFEFLFIFLFSIQNIILYSLFAAGGGHERIKIFSFFIFYYIISKITVLKESREVNY